MNILKEIRNFICLNQKELIQYEYLVSEEHKKLRLYLNNEKDINKDTLEALIQNLIDVAYGNLISILDENIKKINNLIKSLGIEEELRITIKTLEKDIVLDFFRSHAIATLKSSSINDNTGFSTIMGDSTKMSYINNNIEEDFVNGKYINPRLNHKLRNKLKNNEVTWEECWIPIENIEEKFHYRSTLIVPMAIRLNDKDSELFIDKFSKGVDYTSGLRTVWGFLCFDSEEKNIFLNKEDELKDIGYIVADILSLYLMFFYNHISGSDTFNNAIKILNTK